MLPQSCWALLLLCAAPGFVGWMGLGNTPPDLGIPPNIPLEMTAGGNQFQAEATRWEMSPLDSHHCQEKLWEWTASWMPPRLEPPIHHSLQQLVLGETLIANRQHQVAQLMEDITKWMGNVSSHGATELRKGHRVVLSDLHHVQDVYSQLEKDLALLLAQQRRVEEVMEKLCQVNRSLGLVLVAVESARSQLENHLQHLHTVLDTAGQSPSAISTCILYASYFTLLVLLLVLTPPHAILLFLTCSALSELLGIPALSILLALTVAGQWLVVATHRGAGGAWTMLPQKKPHHQLTSTPNREHEMELLQEELDRMEMSCLQEPSCLEQPPAMAGDVRGLTGCVSPIPGGCRTKLSSCGVKHELGVTPEVAMGTRKCWEPKLYSPTESLASDVSLMSPRSPCQGLTRARQQCRKKAIPGKDFCHIHATMNLSPHV